MRFLWSSTMTLTHSCFWWFYALRFFAHKLARFSAIFYSQNRDVLLDIWWSFCWLLRLMKIIEFQLAFANKFSSNGPDWQVPTDMKMRWLAGANIVHFWQLESANINSWQVPILKKMPDLHMSLTFFVEKLKSDPEKADISKILHMINLMKNIIDLALIWLVLIKANLL